MRLAVCQLAAGDDIAANADTAEELVRQAAGQGARTVALPEYFLFYGDAARFAEVAANHTPAAMERFSALAAELGIWLSLGSVLLEVPGSAKVANTSVIYDPAGAERARYAKRHLFDVDLPDRVYRESDVLEAGREIVSVGIEGWTAGLSICFDLRFPEHYAALVQAGAELLLVPAAFTAVTGKAHWEPLLRGRAIETQCYLAAAAQTGECGGGKVCHGHSMIVDPWGAILAELPEGVGVAAADLDRQKVDSVRQSVPMRRPPRS